MSYSKTFEELDKSQHDRASFDCGEKALNDFIQTQAAKHMQAGISRTMVLPASVPLPNQKYPICFIVLRQVQLAVIRCHKRWLKNYHAIQFLFSF